MIDQKDIETWSNLFVTSLRNNDEFRAGETVALVEFRAMFANINRSGGECVGDRSRPRQMEAYRHRKELPGATVQGIVSPRFPDVAYDVDTMTLKEIADALENALSATASGLGYIPRPRVDDFDVVDVVATDAIATDAIADAITKEDHIALVDDELPEFVFNENGDVRGFSLAGMNWSSGDGYVWTAEHEGQRHCIKGLLTLESDGTLQFHSRDTLSADLAETDHEIVVDTTPIMEKKPAKNFRDMRSRFYERRRLRNLAVFVEPGVRPLSDRISTGLQELVARVCVVAVAVAAGFNQA